MAGRIGNKAVLQTGGILSYFTRHKTAANLMLVLLLAAGIAAFPRMRAQFFPDIVFEGVSVSVAWSGAGAQDVDSAIVQIMEPALLAVEGVTGSTATSTEGRANIRLEFETDWNMAQAAEDVQIAVDAVGPLPDGADDPNVRRAGWSDRVTDVVITGPVGVDQLARFADELVIRLFAAGVTQTSISGVAAPSTIVEVPSLSLIRHDIGLSDIAEAIAHEADADPAGDVSGAARVRTGVAKRTAEEISGIVLRSNADGSNLTIGDVARIHIEGIDRRRAFYVDNNPAITLRVNRSARGDAIKLQEIVQEVTDELQTTLPQGVEVALIRARAEEITGRLNLLVDNGIIGLGLVVLLLFLFLNARTAFWVAAGIPVAMSAAIALMYVSGLTINMISLFALIITLGIVVDDAIVVGEHADFRLRNLGEAPAQAAENAARRMFLPVFSATITTVIAFFGLVIIGGRFGDLISDIPFTVIVVLLASLFECFLILPHHMARSMRHTAKEHWYDFPSRVVNIGFGWVRDRLFRRLMRLVIWARYPVIALALVLLSTQLSTFIRGDIQWRFFNSPEQGSISGNFAMLPGATREDSRAMMQELQRATEALGAKYEAEHGTNPLAFVIAQIGGGSGRGLAGASTKDQDQLGAISIELIESDLRPYSSFAFVAELQQSVVQHPMAETVSFRGWRGGPGGDALSVQLFGADAETLKAAAEALKTEVLQFGEVSAVEDNLAYDKEELILELTPNGQALGLTIDGLGRVLRNHLGGIEAATYPDGPRSATIRVELPAGELTADFLERVQMRTPSGIYIPLADIVTVTRRTGFSTIRRENGVMLISVTGDLSEDDPARAEEVTRQIEEDILPRIEANHGVQTALGGLSQQENNFLKDARTGLIFVLTGIYLTLAWIFSSWSRPAVVMAIIPFGLVGTIWGHAAWGVPLSMFTVVGLIGMTGIIINDSIVLITTIDDYAAERGLVPAIIDGVSDRLRAVLLTTLTTVLGLAPLLYEGSSQAEFLKPTVITLVYGLAFGMFMVLFIVPALLAIGQDIGRQVASARRGLHAPALRIRIPTVLGALMAICVFGASIGPAIFGYEQFDLLAGESDLRRFSSFVIALAAGLGGAVYSVEYCRFFGAQSGGLTSFQHSREYRRRAPALTR